MYKMNYSFSTITVDDLNDDKIKQLVAPIVYLFILLFIGVPGNLAIMLIYGQNYRRSVYRSIILNLGAADFLMCSVGIPFNIARVFNYYTFNGRWVCKIFKTLLIFGMIYSTHLLILLTIHRFRKIYMPLKKQISIRNVKFFIVGSFLTALFFTWPQIIVIDLEHVKLRHNLTGRVCAITPSDPSPYLVAYSSTLLSLFSIYTVTLFLAYILIGRKLYTIKHIKLLNADSLSTQKHIAGKMTKIAFTVSVVFGLSYLPWIVLKVTTDYINTKEMSAFGLSMLRIAERLYIVNHVANPFIYAIFDKRFREQGRRLITFKSQSKLDPRSVQTSSTATN